jgi:hypothetical protein
LLDLFGAAVNLTCRDIFVGRIMSENRVDLLQLVKGPKRREAPAQAGEFPQRMLWNLLIESSKAIDQGQIDASSPAMHKSVLSNNLEYVLL